MLPDKCACNVYDDVYAARCHCQFYTWFGAKPQNLKNANISGYTIVHKLRTVHFTYSYLQLVMHRLSDWFIGIGPIIRFLGNIGIGNFINKATDK